jgi:hypothetical protein
MGAAEPALALDPVNFDRLVYAGDGAHESASRRRPTSNFQPGMAAM